MSHSISVEVRAQKSKTGKLKTEHSSNIMWFLKNSSKIDANSGLTCLFVRLFDSYFDEIIVVPRRLKRSFRISTNSSMSYESASSVIAVFMGACGAKSPPSKIKSCVFFLNSWSGLICWVVSAERFSSFVHPFNILSPSSHTALLCSESE